MQAMLGCGSSIWSTGRNNSQKRYYAFEESVKKRTHKFDINFIFVLYILGQALVVGFTMFLHNRHSFRMNEFKV